MTRNIMAFPNVVLILLVLVPFYNFANAKIVIDSKEIVQLQDHRNLTQLFNLYLTQSATSADVNNEGGSHQTNTGIGGIQIFGEDMTDEQIFTTLVDAQNVGGSHQNNVGIGGIQIFGGARDPAIIRKLVADALNREGSHQTNGAIGGILIA
ncbi:unnamed protein product [Orchesella dallaii]|uniref:Uncharacterized protein n=1 Tax=Orchesella dallaii TaxID=48710 RepID=A0ABP1PHG4_9HEXA